MDKLVKAREFAVRKHGDQKYGNFPYEVHLINVINVLLRNGILPDSNINCDIWASAWLHDVLEDTDTSSEEFKEEFGKEIYEIVWALTDGKEGHRHEKKQVMYEKLIHNQSAVIVKLADRISNLEFSIIGNNKDMIKKYVHENIQLNARLNNIITTSEGRILLKYLNGLVNELRESFAKMA